MIPLDSDIARRHASPAASIRAASPDSDNCINCAYNSWMKESSFNIQAEKQKFEKLQSTFESMVIRDRLKATDWNVSIPSDIEQPFIDYMDDHEIVYNTM